LVAGREGSVAGVSPIEEILEEARQGRMFILVDDEDRENEGDLVIPAQCARAEEINFMARHGRGLICLALTRERADWLALKPMSPDNASRYSTAFTVSIEAREGIETGISAKDRAHTIATAISAGSTPYDLVSPGHVFPLVAREGGTLVRAGHTEAAVDIARLAGLAPSGVICEIMNDDGTMARLPDLIAFAQRHGLKIGTIADLIAFRRRNEVLVEKIHESTVSDIKGRQWTFVVFRDKVAGDEHVALVKGEIPSDQPVPVRVQAEDPIQLLLRRGHTLSAAMEIIEQAGRGVVVIIRGRNTIMGAVEERTKPHGGVLELKDFGIGAQILVELGVRNMELIVTTPRAIAALEGFGLRVTKLHEVS